MEKVKGYHGEWNMGSPGGWDYQRIAQILGKMAWDLIKENVEMDVDLDFEDPLINAVPGFVRMILRAHKNHFGGNAVHAVLLAEKETLETVQENRNLVDYLNGLDGVKASLAGPAHLSLNKGKATCNGSEATVIFMDFNLNTLIKIGRDEDIRPIKEAIKQGILVNPKGMEPIGAKGVFEAITEGYRNRLSKDTIGHTPWTRQFYPHVTTDPHGEPIDDLITWTETHWKDLVLKPAHGYSGHGIFVGYKEKNPKKQIRKAIESGDYIVQQLVPLELWSELSAWPVLKEQSLILKEWQTDFRCFITDEGLQGFLARFGGVPTNVGSGGGIQPIALMKGPVTPRIAVDKINQNLLKLGYQTYVQIQDEINRKALELGFTYLLGPIMITLRPRILTMDHIEELRQSASNLWQDALKLEALWQEGKLDNLVKIGAEEKELALQQPWGGGPALMVSDGLFSFGADLIDKGD
jgi:hypothetical protein